MKHGLSLRLFKGASDLLTSRNQVHQLVDKLKSHFLLLDNEEEECVKVHDVICDSIIRIAFEGNGHKVLGGIEIEKPNEDAYNYKAISFILDKLNKLLVGFNWLNYQLL